MSESAKHHQQNVYFDYVTSLEKINRVFDFQVPSLKILDLGCGDGRLSKELVDLGHEVWGVDVNEAGLAQARIFGLQTVQADIEAKIPLEDAQFDLILFLDTLEHLNNPEAVLKEIHRLLKDNGQVIISCPNHFDLRNRLQILFGGGIIHWAHRQYATSVPWAYGHIRFLLFKELAELLNLCGLYIKVSQYNFMAGGVIPRRLTPSGLRKFLLKRWPQLLSGKYVIVADKTKGPINKKIFLPATPKGM